MRSRPWPIIILALFYILGPFFNVVSGMLLMRIPPGPYLHALFAHATIWSIVKLFALYPVAGLAIYAVKEWSYPVYLIIMAIATFLNYLDWRHYSRIFTLPILIGTIVINMALVGYFLIPAVRVAYFNKRLRWWESKPRYDLDVEATIEQEGAESCACRIQNLSEGGAFLSACRDLTIGAPVFLQFVILNRILKVPAKVVHVRPGDRGGYGLQFVHTDETDAQMRRVAKALKLLGLTSRTVVPDRWSDLRQWAVRLFTTGKGLIPEVPSQMLAGSKPAQAAQAEAPSQGSTDRSRS